MMWQKARILKNSNYPDVVGRTIWVKVGRPITTAAVNFATGEITESQPYAEIAIKPLRGPWAGLPADHLELLPEFADDVPLIPWEQFLEECRARLEEEQP